MNTDRIKKALPVETGAGRRSVIRARPDVAEIVADCVLRRRTFEDIARRCGVDIETLVRFRKRFITPEIEKIVMAEHKLQQNEVLDQVINEAQDEVQKGILDIIAEQKALYRAMKKKVEEDGRDLEDILPGLAQLLRDQTKSHEAMLKTYSMLRDKTTILIPLNEHPEAAPLMDALFILFTEMPEARARFREIKEAKRLTINA